MHNTWYYIAYFVFQLLKLSCSYLCLIWYMMINFHVTHYWPLAWIALKLSLRIYYRTSVLYYRVDKHLTIKQSNEWKHVFINHVTPLVVFRKWAEHMFSSTTSFPLLSCSTASVCVHNCKNDLNHMFWLTFMTIIQIYICICKLAILSLFSWVNNSYT